MNLLFDQNISFRVIKKIEDIFPGSKQVKEVKLENESDITIWEYARDNNFCIVTFDADFIDISNLRGSPPKIIWLRIGNTSTYEISNRIREEAGSISEFLNNSELAFLEICQTS